MFCSFSPFSAPHVEHKLSAACSAGEYTALTPFFVLGCYLFQDGGTLPV